MLSGQCHCGAVRFDYLGKPRWLTQCTCSVCRRIGALWVHGRPADITLSYDPDAVIRYCWGDQSLVFVTCRTCGSTTHWEGVPDSPYDRMAVNARMCEPEAIRGLRTRTFDGAQTWEYLD